MKKTIIKTFIAIILLQTSIMPSFAQRWDYVLKSYPNSQEQKIVKDYLDEFHNYLKADWYSPVYRSYQNRAVIFSLNKNGTIDDIKTFKMPKYTDYTPYSTNYEQHIRSYLSHFKFKEFPTELKQDKIKMGYEFNSNFTFLYMLTGVGAVVHCRPNSVFEFGQKESSK